MLLACGTVYPLALTGLAEPLFSNQANALSGNTPVPVDAVTASSSGLDPDIGSANTALQVARVAQARGLPATQVQALVQQLHAGPDARHPG